MATHSSILAWRIPGTEESGELQPMGSQRVGHTEQLIHTHTHTTLHIINLHIFLHIRLLLLEK